MIGTMQLTPAWLLVVILTPTSRCVYVPPPTFNAPRTIGGVVSDWILENQTQELALFNHTIQTPAGIAHGAYLNHFWSAGGKGAVGMYIADTQIVRYYIDGEATASIEFTPSMAAGSGIGFEGLDYYASGLNAKEPWGPSASNRVFGHAAATGGGWHNRFMVPFMKSIRITVQLPKDVPSNATSKVFFIFRGLEGDATPLRVGSKLALPSISPPYNLRLVKETVRINNVQPLDFVSLINHTNANVNVNVNGGGGGGGGGGALFMSIFAINPFGGALEGCIRAYTAATGPNSGWPGVVLSSGTEDYYDSAYYFSHEEGGIFYGADAGLSHKSLGGAQSKLASMYRFHDNDPVYYRDRLELVWRNGEYLESSTNGKKCLLEKQIPGSVPIGGERVDLTFDAWIYTWNDA